MILDSNSVLRFFVPFYDTGISQRLVCSKGMGFFLLTTYLLLDFKTLHCMPWKFRIFYTLDCVDLSRFMVHLYKINWHCAPRPVFSRCAITLFFCSLFPRALGFHQPKVGIERYASKWAQMYTGMARFHEKESAYFSLLATHTPR